MSGPPVFEVDCSPGCPGGVSYITKYDDGERRKGDPATGCVGGAAALAPLSWGDDCPGAREGRSPGGHRPDGIDLSRRPGDGDVLPARLASRGHDEPILRQTAGGHV